MDNLTIVLDPFLGTGTTTQAAMATGRNQSGIATALWTSRGAPGKELYFNEPTDVRVTDLENMTVTYRDGPSSEA